MQQSQNTIPYQPIQLPPDTLDYGQFFRLAMNAGKELTTYNTLLTTLPNPGIILHSLRSEEAVLSSKIEGTQATFDEVLRHNAGLKTKDNNKRDDIQEIINYHKSLSEGHKLLDDGYKINLTFVRGLHKTLMSNVRGENKAPGELRKIQNWIGAPGTSMDNAAFIPPAAGQLSIHMDDWLTYLNNDEEEILTQTALMHAQFELLHPFLDGNGRLGRILIPLFLWQKGYISAPVFYISAYLESNRDAYYQKLRNISDHGDWTGWVRFFLEAVAAQAKANNEKIAKIKSLYEEMKREIQKITHSQFINNILNAIFTNPYSNTADLIENDIPQGSAYHLLNLLEKNGILTVINVPFDRRTKIYRLDRLLDILYNK